MAAGLAEWARSVKIGQIAGDGLATRLAQGVFTLAGYTPILRASRGDWQAAGFTARRMISAVRTDPQRYLFRPIWVAEMPVFSDNSLTTELAKRQSTHKL